MKALAPHYPEAVELSCAAPPEPTHVAVFEWRRWRAGGGSIREVLGNRLVNTQDELQMDALLQLRDRIAVKLGRHVQYDVRPLAVHKERVALSDLERFRRKMLRVDRAYAADMEDVLHSGTLFLEDDLQRVERNYARAVKLVEKNYGFCLKNLRPC